MKRSGGKKKNNQERKLDQNQKKRKWRQMGKKNTDRKIFKAVGVGRSRILTDSAL